MRKTGYIHKVIDFYYEGFSQMETGKTLWLVIVVKLVVIFLVLKLFFMPDVLSTKAEEGREADYVSSRITGMMPE